MTTRPSRPPMTSSSLVGDRTALTSPPPIHDRRLHVHTPPAAYLKQTRKPSPRDSPIVYVPSPRKHSSVSSDGTESSTASTSKINQSYTHPYYMSSLTEQGQLSPAQSGLPKSPVMHSATPQSMSDVGRRTRDDNSAIFRYIQEQQEEQQSQDHAISVLAFLSILDPFYSTFTAFYSILIGLVFLTASPLHLCKKSFSSGDSIVRLLAPLLRKHLQLIHAHAVDDLHSLDFSPTRLVLVHAISPLLSIGVAISAWVAASFWLFALMMGNPDGTERGDDGRATVLKLRNWWEKFLLSSAK